MTASTEHLKGGRPRLDTRPGFKERFATVLPRYFRGEISQGEAARRLCISVRSLKRYRQLWLSESPRVGE